MTGTTWEGVQPSEPEGGWPKDHRTFWPWWVCAPILFLFIGIMARTVVRNSAALPATTVRIVPTRVAINELSGSSPMRSATSTRSSTSCTLRSPSTMRTSMCG